MLDSVTEERKNSKETFSNGFLQIDPPVLLDQQRLIYISSMQTLDVIEQTCQEWYLIGTDGMKEREREREREKERERE